jgi:glycerophosphoryl diester phosphodiesterase
MRVSSDRKWSCLARVLHRGVGPFGIEHGRTYRKVIASAALAVLVGCSSTPARSTAVAPCPPSPYQQKKMLVIAHAGGEGLGPANTLDAMRLSFKAGADVNDADVHITKDGVLVAMHDDTVDATTNGHGLVRDMTLAEIKALDAGYQFTGDQVDFPFRGKGVTVPTIEEILTEFPTKLTSLEFKDDTGDAPKAMCALLRRLGQTKNVYMSSDTDPAIDAFKAICPEVTSTVTDAMVPDLIAAQKDPNSRYCASVPIGQPPYSADRKPTKESMKWSHDHGLADFTWTIDDPETLRYLAEIGMDAVYTRRPDIARKIVDEVAGTTNR